jgi:serine/threonine protein kinase
MSVSGLLEPDTISARNQEGLQITVTFARNESGQRNLRGEGANAPVFRARHEQLQKDIVVKSFRFSASEKERIIKKSVKSVESLYFLSSIFTRPDPNVMCFYGVVVHPSNSKAFSSKIEEVNRNAVFVTEAMSPTMFYMLYELIDGRDLHDIIYDSPRDTDIDFRKYGLELLKALNKLQKAPITLGGKTGTVAMVHLDIKPSNIMIEHATDTLKIIDLNTVCIPWPGKGNSGCDRNSMTLEYTGPEATPGLFPEIFPPPPPTDRRTMLMASDVFAVGLTLYEMIMKKTGISITRDIVPYNEYGWRDFFRKKVSSGEELELDFTPDKGKWASLIQEMVKLDYAKRPSSKEVLARFNEILAWEEGPGSVAVPVEKGGGKKPRKTVRKNRRTKSRRRNRIR